MSQYNGWVEKHLSFLQSGAALTFFTPVKLRIVFLSMRL